MKKTQALYDLHETLDAHTFKEFKYRSLKYKVCSCGAVYASISIDDITPFWTKSNLHVFQISDGPHDEAVIRELDAFKEECKAHGVDYEWR